MWICIVMIQENEKTLIKFAAVSAKICENSQMFVKNIFSAYILSIYFYFLFSEFLLNDDCKILQRYSCPK